MKVNVSGILFVQMNDWNGICVCTERRKAVKHIPFTSYNVTNGRLFAGIDVPNDVMDLIMNSSKLKSADTKRVHAFIMDVQLKDKTFEEMRDSVQSKGDLYK
jgi:hypothetical protein